MTKFVRIIKSDTETILVDMSSVQWVRQTHDGEDGDLTELSVYFAGGTEETILKLEGDSARKFIKHMDLGG